MATKRKDNPKHRAGPKPLPWYDAKQIKDLCDGLRTGASIEIAASRARIGKTLLFERLAAKTPESAELAEQMERARAEGAVGLLAVIGKAATEGNWQAAAKKLEWMYPEVYGRQRIELTGKDGGAVQVAATVAVDLSRLTDDELATARALHAKMQGE